VTELIQQEAKDTPRNIDATIQLFSKQLWNIFPRTRQFELLKMADNKLNEISQDPDAFFHQCHYFQTERYLDLETRLRQVLSIKIETKVSYFEKKFLEKYPNHQPNENYPKQPKPYFTFLNKIEQREQRRKQLQEPAYFKSVIAIGWGE